MLNYLGTCSNPDSLGFPGDSESNESACKAGVLGSIPGLGRAPREGNSYPLHYSDLEKIPWTEEPGRLQSRGRKELDMTET